MLNLGWIWNIGKTIRELDIEIPARRNEYKFWKDAHRKGKNQQMNAYW